MNVMQVSEQSFLDEPSPSASPGQDPFAVRTLNKKPTWMDVSNRALEIMQQLTLQTAQEADVVASKMGARFNQSAPSLAAALESVNRLSRVHMLPPSIFEHGLKTLGDVAFQWFSADVPNGVLLEPSVNKSLGERINLKVLKTFSALKKLISDGKRVDAIDFVYRELDTLIAERRFDDVSWILKASAREARSAAFPLGVLLSLLTATSPWRDSIQASRQALANATQQLATETRGAEAAARMLHGLI